MGDICFPCSLVCDLNNCRYESPRGGRGARGGMRGRGAGAGGPMSAPPYEQPSYADRLVSICRCA